ncbi:LysR family transcriptional regulator [Nonomuraea turkmeniaca]|uniref:LysR family transcriptional regulator n=1 Tax=Nonomuraea turkmeniaca TaxID=103838 RepID=A0A5S4FIB2_9ACTN|nr:LysR substrate-binding domain-containing protein [Nonomuraea turkmeniaca]TMR20249.1 LysR family transcriptional regulator [Nonomuraea turkmeniaca]
MSGLEARELRYFVAVAEELNFSRAAERLGMAQPPLSRAIRQLERRLGADLFTRDTRQVVLTDFGATFLEEARHALEVLTAVDRRARRAAQVTPTLVATAKPGIASGMLRRVAETFRALPGACRVEIAVSGYREQADMVRDGRADVALLSLPYERRGLDSEPLASEPRVAALPADHPLTRRSELRRADLYGEPIPRWAGASEAEHAYWCGREPGNDLPPGPVVGDPSQLLEVVGLGQAVALVPRSVAERNPRSDVTYRPVADAAPYVIAIAWPAGRRSPAIARFVFAATDLYLDRTLVS